jgi:transposase
MTVADPNVFRSGREFAAWLGLVPAAEFNRRKSREQAGHKTASDFCAARYIFSCQAGAIHT